MTRILASMFAAALLSTSAAAAPREIDLCPAPHFEMTKRDGCQPRGHRARDLCPAPYKTTSRDGCK